jgi:integrase
MKLKRVFNELDREWRNNKDYVKSMRLAGDVLDYFGDQRDLRSIHYQDVAGFIDSLKAKGLSGSSINRKLAALSKMYTIARRFDPSITRPEIPRQKEGKPRQRVLDGEEIRKLVDYPWKNPMHREFTVLLMDTGIRPSEIVLGKWSITDDEITLFDTKNGDDRTLPLTPEAKDAALSIRKAGKRLVYGTYGVAFRKACKALGIEGVCPYTMRHTAITKLAEATDNVILIQKWAGHKDLATTQRYVKATRKGMDKLAQVLRRT